ncbi:MAG: DUF5915 domain-containing protein, partial [candidate division NC10 bacterium]
APFTPFVAEEMYQNLVRSVDPQAPDSVHLASYPESDPTLIEAELMEATRLAMRIASMGRAARSKGGLKVRQPLAMVRVKPRSAQERKHFGLFWPQVLDELNIKAQYEEGEDSVLYQRAVQAAGDATDAIVQLAWPAVEDGHEVERHYWVALEGGYMVAVDATVTPELAEEGLARELVHRIQNLRRAADFQVTDRIITYYQAPEAIAQVMMGRHADYIRQETLSIELVAGAPQDGVATETLKLDGMLVTLAVRRI